MLDAIAVFGSVDAFYKSRKKRTKLVSTANSNNSSTIADREILIKYFVMMLAIGAGIVHLAVYSEHGSRTLRLDKVSKAVLGDPGEVVRKFRD
jgi:hypothetical protein